MLTMFLLVKKKQDTTTPVSLFCFLLPLDVSLVSSIKNMKILMFLHKIFVDKKYSIVIYKALA